VCAFQLFYLSFKNILHKINNLRILCLSKENTQIWSGSQTIVRFFLKQEERVKNLNCCYIWNNMELIKQGDPFYCYSLWQNERTVVYPPCWLPYRLSQIFRYAITWYLLRSRSFPCRKLYLLSFCFIGRINSWHPTRVLIVLYSVLNCIQYIFFVEQCKRNRLRQVSQYNTIFHDANLLSGIRRYRSTAKALFNCNSFGEWGLCYLVLGQPIFTCSDIFSVRATVQPQYTHNKQTDDSFSYLMLTLRRTRIRQYIVVIIHGQG